jgi:hypothetical protein
MHPVPRLHDLRIPSFPNKITTKNKSYQLSLKMKKPIQAAFICAVTGVVSSCAFTTSHQVKLDHVQLRDVLMDYADDQIMDNLIRAKNGLPIVHYDFSHVSAIVTTKLAGTVNGGQTLTDTPKGVSGSMVIAAARSAMRPFTFSLAPERDNAIDVEVMPIVSEKQIYEAYVAFLNAPRDNPSKGTLDNSITTTTETNPIKTRSPQPETSDEMKKDEESRTTKQCTKGTIGEKNVDIETDTTAPPSPPPPSSTLTTVTIRSGTVNHFVDFENIHSVQESPYPPAHPEDVLFGERQWNNGRSHYVAKKWRDGKYYWVSKCYKAAFFKLCLATVARGYASAGASGGAPSGAANSGAGSPKQLQQSLDEFNSLQRQTLLQSR